MHYLHYSQNSILIWIIHLEQLKAPVIIIIILVLLIMENWEVFNIYGYLNKEFCQLSSSGTPHQKGLQLVHHPLSFQYFNSKVFWMKRRENCKGVVHSHSLIVNHFHIISWLEFLNFSTVSQSHAITKSLSPSLSFSIEISWLRLKSWTNTISAGLLVVHSPMTSRMLNLSLSNSLFYRLTSRV